MKIQKRIYLNAFKRKLLDGIERHYQLQVSEFQSNINCNIFSEVELAHVDVTFEVTSEQLSNVGMSEIQLLEDEIWAIKARINELQNVGEVA